MQICHFPYVTLELGGAPGKQTQGVEDPWTGPGGRYLLFIIAVPPLDEFCDSSVHFPARDLVQEEKQQECLQRTHLQRLVDLFKMSGD